MRLGYHVTRDGDSLYKSIVREYGKITATGLFKKSKGLKVVFQIFIAGPQSLKLHDQSEEDMQLIAEFIHKKNILLVVHGTYLDRPFGGSGVHSSLKSIADQSKMIHDINKKIYGKKLVLGPIVHLSKMSRQNGPNHDIPAIETDAYKIDEESSLESDLRLFFDRMKRPAGTLIVFDTAHIFESGVDIHDPKICQKFLKMVSRMRREYELQVGFHLNDSKSPLGSALDRHAILGHGYIFRGPGGAQSLRMILDYIHKYDLFGILEVPEEDAMTGLKYVEKVWDKE